MSTVPREKHLHVLRRNPKSKKIFYCIEPECTYRCERVYLAGKLARCYECRRPYVIGSYELQLAKPRCEHCRNDVKSKAFGSALEFFKELSKKEEGEAGE